MGEPVRAADIEFYVERRGEVPDVLLIAGLGDTVEAWQFQLEGLSDRYRLIAYDTRGAGRTPLPDESFSVATLADDAVPTLVLAGGQDIAIPPRLGRVVAEGIPNSRFEILPEGAHQPFQEIPDEFNARADAFWREVETQPRS